MNTKFPIRILIISTSSLMSFAASAQQQDDFSLDQPVQKPEPIYYNFVEGGIGYNHNDLSPFTPFSGLRNQGAFGTGGFGISQRGPWNGNDLFYFNAEGDNLGYDSRSLNAEVGVQGKYEVSINLDQIPYFGSKGITPYLGVGSGTLSLPSHWVSNPNTAAGFTTATRNLPELSSSLDEINFETKRSKYGGGVVWHIDPQWSAKINLQREEKDGLKPLGVAWGTSGGNPAAVIAPETVDYVTDRLEGEIGYATKKMQFRFGYQLSQFNNQTESLRVQNPFTNPAWPDGSGGSQASFPNGWSEMQLAPDNKAHIFRLDGGYNITDRTRVTGNLAYSRYLQNESFLAYTANPLLTVTQGLPLNSLNGEINNTLANIEITSRPTNQWDLRAKYRYNDRDNQTPRSLYIYVAGDAEDQQIGGAETRYRYNLPYSDTENFFGADVGYRLRPGTKISLGYDYRNIERTYSERSETTENTGRLEIRSKVFTGLSGFAKYAHTSRGGSSHNPDALLNEAFTPTYVASLGAAKFVNHPLISPYYEADMERDKLSAGLTYTPLKDLTLSARGSYNKEDYDESEIGLTAVDGWNGSFDATYSLGKDLTLSAFYTYDNRTADQGGWSYQGTNATVKLTQSTDPTRRWWVNHEDRVNTAGLGLKWKITPVINVSADYSYTDAVTQIATRSGGAFTAEDFPDIDTKVHRLGARIDYDLTKQFSLGLAGALENYKSTDWQVDGLTVNTIGRVLTAEDLDPNYNNYVIMGLARYRF